jgi:two-component sensor histidine kinase/sensor domain CHASE-containing protein
MIVCAAMIGLCILLGAALSYYTLHGYARLEIEDSGRQAERAQKSLQEDIDRIASIAGDWAPWDETYSFLEGRNDSFIGDNLSNAAFMNLRLSFVAFVDREGVTKWSRAFDLATDNVVAQPPGFGFLPPDDRLLGHSDLRSGPSGLVSLLDGRIMLVASRPITTSDFQAPATGTLIMGLMMDESELARLSWRTNLDIGILALSTPRMPQDFAAARVRLSDSSPLFVRPIDRRTVASYSLLEDIYGNPAAILRVSIPRSIYEKGRENLGYLFWALAITAAFSSFLVLLIMDRLILKRVVRLGSEIEKIGATRNLGARVEIDGKDELSALAKITNSTLAELERADLALKDSLHEKDLLLREIHHRVKNNLQVVSSLLNLQASVTADQDAIAALKESRSRIHSMALIHELLYSENAAGGVDLARVDFLNYLRHLASYLADSYRVGPARTGMEVEGEEIHLDADAAINCGLVANELISNALKHAFPEDRRGLVSVRISSASIQGREEATLSVSDDGVGISPELDLSKTGSMGWQLVTTLATQCGGRLEVAANPGGGSVVSFSFPLAGQTCP